MDTYQDGLTEKKLTNGKMEIVRDIQYGEDDQISRNEQEYYKTTNYGNWIIHIGTGLAVITSTNGWNK